MSGEPFLARWSRRKQAPPEEAQAEDRRVAAEQPAATGEPAAPTPADQTGAAPPDLPAIESLTPQADFTPFMQARVPAALKNAALKKLFTDPHFNVMDGLDIYIDDYTKSDPIPLEMLRKLAQSRALKLFDEVTEAVAEPAAPQQIAPADPAPESAQAAIAPAAQPADNASVEQPRLDSASH